MHDLEKTTDYWNLRSLWSEHMRIEAADRGYDFAAGRVAYDAYLTAKLNYENRWGIFRWNHQPVDVMDIKEFKELNAKKERENAR